jgi:hypothetical protein
MSGNIPSRFIPHPVYVAGIDLAGEAEVGADDHLKALKPRRDSTVITIGELTFGSSGVGGAGVPSGHPDSPCADPLNSCHPGGGRSPTKDLVS